MVPEVPATVFDNDVDADLGFGVDWVDTEVKVVDDGIEVGAVEEVDVLVDGANVRSDVGSDPNNDAGLDVDVGPDNGGDVEVDPHLPTVDILVDCGGFPRVDIFSFRPFSSCRMTLFAHSSLGLEQIVFPFTVRNLKCIVSCLSYYYSALLLFFFFSAGLHMTIF